jgi:hypothetical protein
MNLTTVKVEKSIHFVEKNHKILAQIIDVFGLFGGVQLVSFLTKFRLSNVCAYFVPSMAMKLK